MSKFINASKAFYENLGFIGIKLTSETDEKTLGAASITLSDRMEM